MASSRVIDTDRGFNAFFRGLAKRSRQVVGIKVGIQGDEADDIGDRDADSPTNVELGTIHEFGADAANIPERSFIRSTVDANRKKYERLLLQAEQAAIKNPKNPTVVKSSLFQLGETAVADIQKRINSNIPPELSPVTIMLKGDSLALVDTGELRGSITALLVGI